MSFKSDYLEATEREKVMSKVFCLLEELDGQKFGTAEWRGYHPRVYGRYHSEKSDDRKIAELCKRLRSVDVSKYSLEMQIWWRDHQANNKARLKQEMEEMNRKEERAKAIEKLTPYERKLLGLDQDK